MVGQSLRSQRNKKLRIVATGPVRQRRTKLCDIVRDPHIRRPRRRIGEDEHSNSRPYGETNILNFVHIWGKLIYILCEFWPHE